jgi:hypothetical protein
MLKLLACLFMLLDHIGYYYADVLPDEIGFALRCVGRLAFPIFAWSVAQGYRRTHSIIRYFFRMAAFAAVTEAAFIYFHRLAGLRYEGTNVLVTFSLALVLLAGFQLAFHSTLDMIASLRPVSPTPHTLPCFTRYDVRINLGGIELDRRIGLPLGLFIMLTAIAGTLWLHPDYGLYGLATVLLFYIVNDCLAEKNQEKFAIIGFVAINLVNALVSALTNWTGFAWAIVQCLAILALPLCYARQAERRPSAAVKYAFYVFYPLHVIVLLLIRTFF